MESPFMKTKNYEQRGATLVMALIVLVLIMILGIAAVNSSTTQFKISANLQFEDAAMNSAELAVDTAESWLTTGANFNTTDFFTTNSTPGLLQITASNNPVSMSWDSTDSISAGAASRYTIQLMSINSVTVGSSAVIGGQSTGGCSSVNTYLITGYGSTTRGAKKIIQSYYGVKTC